MLCCPRRSPRSASIGCHVVAADPKSCRPSTGSQLRRATLHNCSGQRAPAARVARPANRSSVPRSTKDWITGPEREWASACRSITPTVLNCQAAASATTLVGSITKSATERTALTAHGPVAPWPRRSVRRSFQNSHPGGITVGSSDLLDQLQTAIGAAYIIDREVGRGGMATVYLAADANRARPVALKVLSPRLAASLGPERFRREIAIAAKLQHPHILTILDSGGTPSGRVWFTMPSVEGRDRSRARLTRKRQIALEDALRIAREVADALVTHTSRGSIRRRRQPGDILLSRGRCATWRTLVWPARWSLVEHRPLGGADSDGRRCGARDADLHESRAGDPGPRAGRAHRTCTRWAAMLLRCWPVSRRMAGPRRRRYSPAMSGDIPSVRRIRPACHQAWTRHLRSRLPPCRPTAT